MQKKKKPYKLAGLRSGHLVVIGDTEKTIGHNRMWLCRCDCGRLTLSKQFDLLSGRADSCGCYRNRPSGFITVFLSDNDDDIRQRLAQVDNMGLYIKRLIREDAAAPEREKTHD